MVSFDRYNCAFPGCITFETLQKPWKTRAAKIQECGNPPTQEAVLESARAYQKGGGSEKWLRDWYSFDFAHLPKAFARIICQRSNCWWDTKLRRTYANIIIGAICILAVFALGIGIATNLTLETFILAVVAPIAPVCIWGIREGSRQRNTADNGDRLLQHAESFWKKACEGLIKGGQLEDASRELQCEIYDRRRNSPVNPAWLYSDRRNEYQELMVKGAQELIQQYKQKQCG